jgi:hypothetical protein
MHTHRCDLERLIKCGQGDREALHPIGHRLLAECGQRDIDGSTRQFEDCRQNVAWPGWYLCEENENTRKLRSAVMATPTQSSETLMCGLFRDELSRLSSSSTSSARTCLKPVVLEGSDKDSG